jgi:hypothetical protein
VRSILGIIAEGRAIIASNARLKTGAYIIELNNFFIGCPNGESRRKSLAVQSKKGMDAIVHSPFCEKSSCES